jgi:hypothetical protein
MNDVRRVLELVAQGKITPTEAEELLNAMKDQFHDASTIPQDETGSGTPRYLRIFVHKIARAGHREQDVNLRVPLSIVRGGLRLGAIIPGYARERMRATLRERGVDIDLTKIDPATIESLIKNLGEINIDVNEGEEQVRITCE